MINVMEAVIISFSMGAVFGAIVAMHLARRGDKE